MCTALAVACGDSTDDTTDTDDTDTEDSDTDLVDTALTFGEEEELTTSTSTEDMNFYLPMGWFGGLAVKLKAPDPPFEIRAISALMYNRTNSMNYEEESGNCTADVPVNLVAWVGENPKRATEDGEPLPALATVEASGDGLEGGADDGYPEMVTGVLDEPVLVTEDGKLYVAIVKGEPQVGRGACAASMAYSDKEAVWMLPDGEANWNEYEDSVPDIRITVAQAE